jgi:2,3-diketo-5-methylthio-1-phosphopentane phosphatase
MTFFDVLDDIIKRFSINKNWVAFEKAWKNAKIGSKACLEGQLRSVSITKKELSQYLSQIIVDPHFHKFFAMLKRERIKPVILSDNFTFIIESILRNNGINGIKIYANELRFHKDRLIPLFPYTSKRCFRCAHCKKKNLLKKGVRDKIIIYIGDGLSDICPAECSDLVFAKGSLLKYLRKTRRLCLAFSNLEDIENYFRGLEK